MPYAHFAARATPGHAPFESMKVASWAWQHIRELFDDTLAAVLMPNHVQLVAWVDDVAAARRDLARTLGHLQRWWAPGREVWERVRMPKIVAPGQSLLGDLRYIELNPARAKLCRDPLEWPWSTHRDVMGAVVDPWVTIDRIAHAFRPSALDLIAWWHGYVSGDPSVAVGGTPVPRAAAPATTPNRSLNEIVCATAAALRVSSSRLREHPQGPRLFFALARHQGWTDTATLARAIGTSQRTAQRACTVEPAALRAAVLCLGDARLWAPFADDEPGRRKNSRVAGEPSRLVAP